MGTHQLLAKQEIRVVIFEYHLNAVWAKTNLQDVVVKFDEFGYDCFFQGSGDLWPLSGTNCVVVCYKSHEFDELCSI